MGRLRTTQRSNEAIPLQSELEGAKSRVNRKERHAYYENLTKAGPGN